jgi:hypothetical protein
METSDYARFIQDCVAAGTAEDHGLTDDQLYGVYVSWCGLDGQPAACCEAFRAAMAYFGLHAKLQNNRRNIWPGLRMTGPAALDYILTSRPSLV